MDLQELFDQRLEKIDRLKDFITVYGEKAENIEKLKKLSEKSDEIKDLLKQCAESIEKFQSHNRERVNDIIKRSQQQQSLMFSVLEKLEDEQPKKINSFVAPPSVRKQYLQGKENIFQTPTQKTKLPKLGETPLMTFDDYMKSPFTLKKTKPITLQFADFSYSIPPTEFLKVPRYLSNDSTNLFSFKFQ